MILFLRLLSFFKFTICSLQSVLFFLKNFFVITRFTFYRVFIKQFTINFKNLMFFFVAPVPNHWVFLDLNDSFNLIFCLSCLFCLLCFILFQTLFLREVLLFFVSLDLVFTFVSVLFILLVLLFRQSDGIIFFFVILAVVACETALGLGFLVSFSRRHGVVTFSSLRYLVH